MKQAPSILKIVLVIFFSFFLNIAAAKSETKPSFYSQAELAQLLAPIALYPDTLLTHILIAATYPLEVIAAERWLTEQSDLSIETTIKRAAVKDWDASVIALLAFPRVLNNLSSDIAWMQKLGDAFLEEEAELLINVQFLRAQADEAGNLAQMENVNIVRQPKTIIIEPAKPDIIYVPYYDSRVVYGDWHWPLYQPVYWHRPLYFSYHRRPFYWRSGIHISFDFFFNAFHWTNHHIVVHHQSQRHQHYQPRRYHSRQRISTSSQAKRWQHNPYHRKGVGYRSDMISKKYLSNRPSQVRHTVGNSDQKSLYNSNKLAKNNYRNETFRQVNSQLKASRYSNNKSVNQRTKNDKIKKPSHQNNVAYQSNINNKKYRSNLPIPAHRKASKTKKNYPINQYRHVKDRIKTERNIKPVKAHKPKNNHRPKAQKSKNSSITRIEKNSIAKIIK